MKHIMIFTTLLLILGCKNVQQDTSNENSESLTKNLLNVSRTKGALLILNDSSHINTRLYSMNYLESLIGSKGVQYFVLSGRTCNECDENVSIFLLCQKDTLLPLNELPKYTFPGKVYDYENDQLNFESKLYIGNCISENKDFKCLIWLQKERNSKDSLESSMFIVDILNDRIRERKLKSQTREYNENLRRIINCKEIKGIDTMSEP